MIYWLYRALSRLPLPLLYAASSLLAGFLYHIVRYRRSVVRENIANSFPERSRAWRKSLEKDFYQAFCDSSVEIIATHALPLPAFREHVQVVNPELLMELSDNNQRSVTLVLIHQGNWEWALHAVQPTTDLRLDPVYKPLHSEGADRFAFESRSRSGGRPISMRQAARDILKYRRTPRIIALVADQAPGRRARAHWTEFLNQDTPFFTGPEDVAKILSSPVAFVHCRRQRRGKYRIEFETLTRDPTSLEPGELLTRYAQVAERAIQEEPESYLWSNRRWKRRAEDYSGQG